MSDYLEIVITTVAALAALATAVITWMIWHSARRGEEGKVEKEVHRDRKRAVIEISNGHGNAALEYLQTATKTIEEKLGKDNKLWCHFQLLKVKALFTDRKYNSVIHEIISIERKIKSYYDDSDIEIMDLQIMKSVAKFMVDLASTAILEKELFKINKQLKWWKYLTQRKHFRALQTKCHVYPMLANYIQSKNDLTSLLTQISVVERRCGKTDPLWRDMDRETEDTPKNPSIPSIPCESGNTGNALEQIKQEKTARERKEREAEEKERTESTALASCVVPKHKSEKADGPPKTKKEESSDPQMKLF